MVIKIETVGKAKSPSTVVIRVLFPVVIIYSFVGDITFNLNGRDSWSSGYGRWLMFERSWVEFRILDGHDIFHIDLLLKNCIVCLKTPKGTKKRPGLANFCKNIKHLTEIRDIVDQLIIEKWYYWSSRAPGWLSGFTLGSEHQWRVSVGTILGDGNTLFRQNERGFVTKNNIYTLLFKIEMHSEKLFIITFIC